MKKTLVALAALAATGAFAQVTITGTLAYGYTQSNTANALASGLGVDTAELVFAAKEDLGGGMSADAKLVLDTVAREGVAGGDSVLGLDTSAGRFQFYTAKGADYLSGGVAGVAGIGMDGKVFSARSVRDAVAYIAPMGGLTMTIAHMEGANLLGLGKGAAGSAADTVGQRVNVFGLGYKSGALAANGQFLAYDNRTDNSDASDKDVLRMSASYDFGNFKLGAGYSQGTKTSSATAKDALIGASMPMGSLTLGAQWAQRKTDGFATAANNGTKNGSGLSATYALSKRTSLAAVYRAWDNGPTNGIRDDKFDLLIGHSF